MKTLAPVLVAALATGCIIRLDAVPGGGFDEVRSESVTLPADLSDYTLDVPAGDISIVAGAEPGVLARLGWQTGDDAPRLVSEEAGSVVTHTWRCEPNRSCIVDLQITVPEMLDGLSVDLDAGDLDIADLIAPLVVDLDAGDVDLVGHTGRLDIALDAGSIRGSDLDASTVAAEVDAGSIDLELMTRPESVTASSDAGDVDLIVPSGAYALDLDTDVGSVDVGVGITDDPSADASLTVQVDVGSISVNGI